MTLEDIKDAFQPYSRLVEIEICGAKCQVPENNSLLRCFQFLSLESISFGDFCWNGECLNCQVWIGKDGREKACMACRTTVAEGMTIVRISENIDLSEAHTPAEPSPRGNSGDQ